MLIVAGAQHLLASHAGCRPTQEDLERGHDPPGAIVPSILTQDPAPTAHVAVLGEAAAAVITVDTVTDAKNFTEATLGVLCLIDAGMLATGLVYIFYYFSVMVSLYAFLHNLLILLINRIIPLPVGALVYLV